MHLINNTQEKYRFLFLNFCCKQNIYKENIENILKPVFVYTRCDYYCRQNFSFIYLSECCVVCVSLMKICDLS